MTYKTYEVQVCDNGAEFWCLNGKQHREDGPASTYVDGTKYWYLNGKLHRVNGPAIECVNGFKAWYLNGLRHREDGPSIRYVDGRKEWYLSGKQLTEEQFNQRNQSTCEGKVVEIEGKQYKLIAI